MCVSMLPGGLAGSCVSAKIGCGYAMHNLLLHWLKEGTA